MPDINVFIDALVYATYDVLNIAIRVALFAILYDLGKCKPWRQIDVIIHDKWKK